MDISPSFSEFETAYNQSEAQLVYARIIADYETPVSLYQKIVQKRMGSFILESVTGGENRARYSIIGTEPDLIFRVVQDQAQIWRENAQGGTEFTDLAEAPLQALQNLIDESAIHNQPENLPAPAAGIFGFLGYDMIRQVENLPDINPDPIGTEDAIFVRPKIVIVIDNVKHEAIICTAVYPQSAITAQKAYLNAQTRLERILDLMNQTPSQQRYGLTSLAGQSAGKTGDKETSPARRANISHEDFLNIVKKAKAYIEAGDIFQVVLSQRWTTEFTAEPFELYRALRRTNPSPYMFFFDFEDFHVIGASPEILVSLKGDEVTIRPIAGTRPRGQNAQEDKALELDLLADEKELAEHLMLLDLGRNDVGRVCEIGSVRPTEEFIVERYSHVMHIVSNVIGKLKSGKTALNALLSGMPAGTLSGAPKIRAMQIIDELETEKRGIYGGGVGYFSAFGDMDICIALRTAILRNKTLYIQAGAGIVFDSDPEMEYQECVHKSRALFAAADEARRHSQSNN